MNKDIIKTLFPEAIERIDEGKCPACAEEIDIEVEFEDDSLAMREYLISGMCKKCQDATFNDKTSNTKSDCGWV